VRRRIGLGSVDGVGVIENGREVGWSTDEEDPQQCHEKTLHAMENAIPICANDSEASGQGKKANEVIGGASILKFNEPSKEPV
jgi:hypothetical protein